MRYELTDFEWATVSAE